MKGNFQKFITGPFKHFSISLGEHENGISESWMSSLGSQALCPSVTLPCRTQTTSGGNLILNKAMWAKTNKLPIGHLLWTKTSVTRVQKVLFGASCMLDNTTQHRTFLYILITQLHIISSLHSVIFHLITGFKQDCRAQGQDVKRCLKWKGPHDLQN